VSPLERWNLLGVSDLSTPLPPIPWVCEPLGLAPGAVSLVAGYGYSRKTMALQSLGLSVAAGRPAWGLWSVRKGPFVHLDYEQGRRLTQERYQRLARGMGFELADLGAGSLRVACMPRAYLDESGVFDELVSLVGDAVLVLVDSLRAAFPHADENSSEVRTYLDVLSRVSERTGAAIAVIHHARKPNAQNGGTATHAIRGSSALFDACQSVYVFEGAKDTPTRVHHEKDRVRGTTLAEFGLTTDDVAGASGPRHGLAVRHLEVEQLDEAAFAREDARETKAVDDMAERIVRAIAEVGWTFHGSAASARDLVRGRTETRKAAWAKLVSAGILVREGTHHEPIWRIASVTVPSVPSGSNPVPGTASNPVPGPPPFKGGPNCITSDDSDPVPDSEPSTDLPAPDLLGPENLFGDLLPDDGGDE
jgi:hypothetical protein